LKHTNTNTQIT